MLFDKYGATVECHRQCLRDNEDVEQKGLSEVPGIFDVRLVTEHCYRTNRQDVEARATLQSTVMPILHQFINIGMVVGLWRFCDNLERHS